MRKSNSLSKYLKINNSTERFFTITQPMSYKVLKYIFVNYFYYPKKNGYFEKGLNNLFFQLDLSLLSKRQEALFITMNTIDEGSADQTAEIYQII